MREPGAIFRGVIGATIVVALAAFIVLVRPPSYGVTKEGKTVIRVWHSWGGPILERYVQSVESFEQAHPDIECSLLYVPNDLSSNQKFYTAVLGNCAPEVTFVDGPQVAGWAERGLLTPLDDLLVEAGYDLKEFASQFYEPCWKQCVYKGKIWGITFCADPNFAFFWNKDAFGQAVADGDIPAGAIDLDRPPQTIDELDRWNDAIVKWEDTGAGRRLVRIGLVPWGIYGEANSLFTWGWAFGGEFYDAENFRVTANDPKIVTALEWMCSYSQKYDWQRVSALQSSFGTAQQNPFLVGRQAVQLYHLSGVDDIDRYKPQWQAGEDYGVAEIPRMPGVEASGAWVGGWALAIPAGVTDPKLREAALDYILWACASAEGTQEKARSKALFPGWKPSPFGQEVSNDPRLKVYMDILANCRHQRPVMPAQDYYMNQLTRAVQRAIQQSDKWTPQAALDEATANTQEFLDKMLEEGRRREGR